MKSTSELPIVPKPSKTTPASTSLQESVETQPVMPPQEEVQLNEVALTWAGKLFFASLATYIASDVASSMKLPIKLRGKPEQIRAVTDAITASKEYQREIKKPGASVESVIQKLNLRNMSKERFEQLTGKKWPV